MAYISFEKYDIVNNISIIDNMYVKILSDGIYVINISIYLLEEGIINIFINDKLYNEHYKKRDMLEEFGQFDEKAKNEWFPRIQKLDRLRTKNGSKIQIGRNNPILSEPLKQDIRKLESKYKLFDVATDNVKGGKIIDAEPSYAHFDTVFKYEPHTFKTPEQKKTRLKDILGSHEYSQSLVKPKRSKIKIQKRTKIEEPVLPNNELVSIPAIQEPKSNKLKYGIIASSSAVGIGATAYGIKKYRNNKKVA